MKKRMLAIGIVGCGAIGTSLARAITRNFGKKALLAALYDIDQKKSRLLSEAVSKKHMLVCADLGSLIAKSDLVIECSCAASALGIAKRALRSKKDIMIMSVGGILSHAQALRRLASLQGACVYIPSGAIAGIDGVKASSFGSIRKVTLTTSKNPFAFSGVEYLARKKIDLRAIKSDTVLFSGKAALAVKYFPQNINVAGVLSVAGVGAEKTRVVIRASPGLHANVHEIEIESEAGRIYTRTENKTHPSNPKTSYLAVLSAIAMINRILEPFKIGT